MATRADTATSEAGARLRSARGQKWRGRRSDAVEATGPDQLHHALQAAAEGIDVVVGRVPAGQRGEPGAGGHAGDQLVIEGLVAEGALGLPGNQELQEEVLRDIRPPCLGSPKS